MELTPAGADSIITRLVDDPAKNIERWKKLPYLMDYQEPGTPKPGAAVLAEMNVARPQDAAAGHAKITAAARTAVLATGGTWRWQMSQPLGDPTHDMFWQQLLRWLVTDSPGQVVAAVPSQMLFDDGRVQLSADVRDKSFQPAPDAHVEAHILGPERLFRFRRNVARSRHARPVPGRLDRREARLLRRPKSSRSAAIEELGRDVLTFQRMDGVAENFHTEQNRDLLEKLAAQTGGRYWRPDELSQAARRNSLLRRRHHRARNQRTVGHARIFLLLILLRFSEWLLRRKWGVV